MTISQKHTAHTWILPWIFIRPSILFIYNRVSWNRNGYYFSIPTTYSCTNPLSNYVLWKNWNNDFQLVFVPRCQRYHFYVFIGATVTRSSMLHRKVALLSVELTRLVGCVASLRSHVAVVFTHLLSAAACTQHGVPFAILKQVSRATFVAVAVILIKTCT